jgi:hypothetical protein
MPPVLNRLRQRLATPRGRATCHLGTIRFHGIRFEAVV